MKNLYFYISLILGLILIIFVINTITIKVKLKNLTSEYDNLSIIYDSLYTEYQTERLILQEELLKIESSLKISKAVLRNLETQNKITENQRLRLEQEILKYNTIRNESSKKVYTPDQLDNRLITILRE